MSSIVYHRNATTLRDAFVYLNDDGTFNTGRVQGDFTIKLSKDGTGNQSTTGVTITEVDAVHNPGEYAVVAASSAFPATNGTYVLVITRTADAKQTFEQIYIVNDTGDATATPSSFTATASDGRVTDGVSPIEDADVFINNGSTFITQTTTDASGLWGPVYLGDGTFTIRAQKSGYSQGTGSIVVLGASVTGPGTDIALVLGSTANPLSAAQLWAYARRQAVDLTGTKADTIIKSAVNDALDMVSSERLWPHLLRRGYLSLQAPYTTGTIAISGTTVTLTGGTWPTWAASGRLFFSGQVIDIASRTSSSVVELEGAWAGTAVTAASYTLFQNEYDLPDDMWRFHELLPGQRWGWSPEPVSPAEVFEAENLSLYGQPFANVFCIVSGAASMWPYPSASTTVAYTYYARPARLTLDTEVADWDPVHLVPLHRAIDYQLAMQVGMIAGDRDAPACLNAYRQSLSSMVVQDKTPTDLPPSGGRGAILGARSHPWRRGLP